MDSHSVTEVAADLLFFLVKPQGGIGIPEITHGQGQVTQAGWKQCCGVQLAKYPCIFFEQFRRGGEVSAMDEYSSSIAQGGRKRVLHFIGPTLPLGLLEDRPSRFQIPTGEQYL